LRKAILCLPVIGLSACTYGVPYDYVLTETSNAFKNTSSVAAHLKAKCGEAADSDTDCKESKEKLAQACNALDELATRAEGHGFDCSAWKEKP
jgi:hypothetical protein